MFTAELCRGEMVGIVEQIFQDGGGPFWSGMITTACGAAGYSTSWAARSPFSVGTLVQADVLATAWAGRTYMNASGSTPVNKGYLVRPRI
jgi:hypothetical protein